MKGIHYWYSLLVSEQGRFQYFRVSMLSKVLSNMRFPRVSKQGNPGNRSFLSLGNLQKPGVSLCFPTDFIVGYLKFLCVSPSGKSRTQSALVSYLRETCGKPWVSMWLPLCVLWVIRISLYFPSFFPFETRDFNVVFHLCLCRKLHVSPMKPDRTKTFSFRGNHVDSSSLPSGNHAKT